MRIRLGCLCALALALVASLPARSQTVPKPGGEYEDTANIGFRIKVPDGWDFVPPQPNEQNEIGRYSAGTAGVLRNQKNGQPLWNCDMQLLKFDRRVKPDDAAVEKERFVRPSIENLSAWLSNMGGKWKADPKKELTISKISCVRYSYSTEVSEVPLRLLAYEYKVQPDFDVAVVFYGPGEDKKWSKFENAYDTMGKSFKTLALGKALAGAKGTSMRDLKRAALELEVASQPGWALYETPNYFIISGKNDDKPFIEELKERLEAIRKVYEELYPASDAAKWRMNSKVKKDDEPKPEAEDEDEDEDEPGVEGHTEAAKPVDPMEMSRCSIVRICKDQEGYMTYGGPPRSAGYWSSYHKELVIYDDQASGGRNDTWITLNHEAFHQYIYYFFGQLAPHSWYNEGTGDFFSGYQLERKKFTLKENSWRQREVQGNIRQDLFVPWKVMVRFTQQQYYSEQPEYGTDPGAHYAQGWSMIYFLRTAKKKAKCWNPAWDLILGTYLQTLAETDDLDAAVDKAFVGVDWDEIENCWKAYTLDG